jgi:hypothetical protein
VVQQLPPQPMLRVDADGHLVVPSATSEVI